MALHWLNGIGVCDEKQVAVLETAIYQLISKLTRDWNWVLAVQTYSKNIMRVRFVRTVGVTRADYQDLPDTDQCA